MSAWNLTAVLVFGLSRLPQPTTWKSSSISSILTPRARKTSVISVPIMVHLSIPLPLTRTTPQLGPRIIAATTIKGEGTGLRHLQETGNASSPVTAMVTSTAVADTHAEGIMTTIKEDR